MHAWKIQKRIIAMINWANKKKSGAVVTFRTHLLLYHVRKIAEKQKTTYIITIYEAKEIQYKPMRECHEEQTYRKCSDEIESDGSNLR